MGQRWSKRCLIGIRLGSNLHQVAELEVDDRPGLFSGRDRQGAAYLFALQDCTVGNLDTGTRQNFSVQNGRVQDGWAADSFDMNCGNDKD